MFTMTLRIDMTHLPVYSIDPENAKTLTTLLVIMKIIIINIYVIQWQILRNILLLFRKYFIK